jgi:nitroimidazol reductase NimA-like FMN-containing flavoprotein (pyridoxamine 5'-phosphate oxidase superfamily)
MSQRTRIQRLPEKAATEVEALRAVLDAARVAHVAFQHDGSPVNIPTACARDGERLLLHGSTASRMMRTLATGVPVCVAVTLLDGLVLARSAFESSMHYRSAVIYGSTTPVEDKLVALRAMSEAWMPGRWNTLRPPTAKELAATLVLELALTEWSVKVSNGDPDDPPEDLDEPVWAGVLPILTSYGVPVPAPDLRGDPPVPGYLGDWKA